MDRLEQELLRSASALVVEPPLLRRVVKAHRGASGLVPHPRCYPIARAELVATGLVNELGVRFDELPEHPILLGRVAARDRAALGDAAILARYWRAVFHARIHVALDRRAASGELDAAAMRARIDRIGQIEFDEVRAMLRHDDLVLPPYDDREVYVEFAALYLELRHFAPTLLVSTFPGIADFAGLDAMFAADLDVAALLDEGRPPEVPRPTVRPIGRTNTATQSTQLGLGAVELAPPEPPTAHKARALVTRARRARAEGNDVGAILAASYAALVPDDALSREADGLFKESIASLAGRLAAALRPVDGAPRPRRSAPSWGPLLLLVGERAAAERGTRFSVEARLLYTLQLAALAHERPSSTVDLVGHALSRRARPMVRPLPATRELRIARKLGDAAKLVRHARVATADRKLLARLVDFAKDIAEDNLRGAVRPVLRAALDRGGLVAASDPERLSREKLIEELLDTTLDQGFLSFGALRDALSRNQLKLPDLASADELLRGDPLLSADRILAAELEGLYRPAEIYLRGFQKLSSVPFGTAAGRAFTLYFGLPVGAAAILLEAVQHLAEHLRPGVAVLTPVSLALVTALVFALVHSRDFRRAAGRFVEVLGLGLALLFVRLPRALFARPTVRRWLALPEVRFALRRVVFPGLVAAVFWYFLPLRREDRWLGLAAGLACFLGTSLLLDTRVGVLLEDLLFDRLAPGWQVVSRRWLPSLVRATGQFFERLLERVERGIYRVDEALRFRQGQSQAALWAKGVLGVSWGVVAYAVRFYVTLMIEPFINPLKHFPVVVVADKLMLAYLPRILELATKLFSPFGTILGGFLAWMTMFFSPSIFGFLAWELKENYKLYRATRPEGLVAAPIGRHGETMRGLLVVGMHSGTLPKLYERLRRAAQREEDAAELRGHKRTGVASSLGSFREGLHEVEGAVSRFFERELSALLAGAPRWTFGEVAVEGVELSSNRVRVKLGCHELSGEPCELRFEEQGGMVVASVAAPGFLAELTARSADGVRLFENALAGLYQRAEVEIVREQLEAELGRHVAYDIADGALLVWPGEGYRTEVTYRLDRAGPTLPPEVKGAPAELPLRVLDARNVFYREQSIGWDAWVSAWSSASHRDAPLPRLVRGTSLLPLAPPAEG